MGMLAALRNTIGAELYARRKVRERLGEFVKTTEWSRLFERGLEHLAVRDQVLDPYSQVADVYACVHAIASQGASVNYGLYDGENRVEEHELYDLFGKPNEHVVGSEFIETTLVYLELCGEVFWYLDQFAQTKRDGSEAPRTIYFLHPGDVKEEVKDERLVAWKWQPANRPPKTLSIEQVFHLGYPNPNNPIRGLAPLSAAMLSVNTLYKARRWQANFFASGGLPPFYVNFPNEVQLTPDQIETLKQQFRNEYLGYKNAGKVPFLFRGGKLETVSPTQKEMDWLETMKYEGDQVGAVYGVPPIYRGVFQANFAVRDQKRIMLYETVFPKLQFLGTAIQQDIVDRFWGGLTFGWEKKQKVAEAIPEDVHDAIKSVKELFSMGVPFSEAAKMLGLEVDTAGKPWLDEGFLPFNLMPAGEVASQTVPEPALLPVPAEDETADAAKGVVPFHLRGSKRRLAFIRSLEALWEGTARAYRLRYQSWLYGLRTETLAALDAVSGTAASAAAAAGGIRSVSVRALEDPETVMFDLDAAAGDLVQTSMPSWKQGLKIGGKSVIDELSIDGTFDMDAAEAQAFLKVKTFKIKVEHQIVGVVHERVRRAIAAGIAEREDIQAIKDRVREAFNVERARSLAIARTEVGQSFAGGRFIEMQGEGVKRHQWLTAGDDAVRESHEDMDGEIQVIGEEFSNGLLYPLQANSNDAGEVVNCRCAAVAVLE